MWGEKMKIYNILMTILIITLLFDTPVSIAQVHTPQICIPNRQYTSGSCIDTCNENGTNYSIKCCDKGLYFNETSHLFECQESTSNYGNWIIFIFVLAMFIAIPTIIYYHKKIHNNDINIGSE